MKNLTKEKIWSVIAIVSFFAFLLLAAITIAVAIIKISVIGIFLVALLVIIGIIFYTAAQKADFYSCFPDQDSD